MAAPLSPQQLSEKHRHTLDQALDTIRTRAYWSPHPEHPKAYGENAPADGLAAFQALHDHVAVQAENAAQKFGANFAADNSSPVARSST